MFWNNIVQPFLLHSTHNFVARTVFGTRIAGNSSDFVARYIYFFGIWEPNLTAWLASRLRSGDVFVDVGANLGYFTLLASQLVGPTGRVIAIEASPSIFRRLVANVRLNSCNNVELHEVAAADRSGTVRVFLAKADNYGATSLLESRGGRLEADVRAQPLSDIVSEETMSRVRMIKIDVEGAEALVLDGLVSRLGSARRDLEIVVEINPVALKEQGRDVEELFHALHRHGFMPYRLENDYSAEPYLVVKPVHGLTRIRGQLKGQTDVVFSKNNADSLGAAQIGCYIKR